MPGKECEGGLRRLTPFSMAVVAGATALLPSYLAIASEDPAFENRPPPDPFTHATMSKSGSGASGNGLYRVRTLEEAANERVMPEKVEEAAKLGRGAAASTLYPARNAAPLWIESGFGANLIKAVSSTELRDRLCRIFFNCDDGQSGMAVAPKPAASTSAATKRSTIVSSFVLFVMGGTILLTWAMLRAARLLRVANRKCEMQRIRHDAALNSMAQAILMYDSSGELIFANHRFAVLFGGPWEEWRRSAFATMGPEAMRRLHDLTDGTATNAAAILTQCQKSMEHCIADSILFDRPDGRTFSVACVPMADGGVVFTFEDMTERRRAEDQVSHMGRYDVLTDLPGRTIFYEGIEELLRDPQNASFAVFSLDLDHFKSVNDTLGHPIGDKLLQMVAARISGCVRETDIVARLGSDEFAVVQTTLSEPAVSTILAARLIDTLGAPYHIDGHQVIVGTSVGIAIAPQYGMDPDTLVKHADLALYRCKADGGNTFRTLRTANGRPHGGASCP